MIYNYYVIHVIPSWKIRKVETTNSLRLHTLSSITTEFWSSISTWARWSLEPSHLGKLSYFTWHKATDLLFGQPPFRKQKPDIRPFGDNYPLPTIIPVRSQWGRYNTLPRSIAFSPKASQNPGALRYPRLALRPGAFAQEKPPIRSAHFRHFPTMMPK